MFVIYSTLFLVLSPVLVVTKSSCDSLTTCDECIQDASGCVWCAQRNTTTSRCKLRAEATSWCDSYQIDPRSIQNITENLDFNNATGNIIQIKPQKSDFSIRLGDSVNFEFSFKSISGYPVDLYFLIDVSKSMNKIIKSTVNQIEDIYRTMTKFTGDVRLGFGSFVDKNSFPFTNQINSTNTYSFKHHLGFTKNHKVFTQHIKNTHLGQNNDDPEGGLDGLSQVIACKRQIGWRKESRKIIIFLTDATYHAAGDGKWAGLVKPYDGKCYMSENGTYSKELKLDYPSVSIISKMAREEEMIIIFGIRPNVAFTYMTLVKAIKGSIYISSDDFENNMANTLKSTYRNITQNIKFITSIPPAVRNSFVFDLPTKCENALNKQMYEACKVEPGKEMKFRGKLTLHRLPKSEVKNMKLNISIEGIDEKFVLNVNIITKCNCDVEYNSSNCQNQGIYRCGICECNPNRYGKICECEMNSQTKGNNSRCIQPGTNVLCSGHGSCSCSECRCRNGRVGPYCECDNENCKQVDGSLCSGHGVCECGICKCDPEWSEKLCDCPKSEDKCYERDPKLKCSNAGKCKCNSCQCDPIAEWDARLHHNDVCEMLRCDICHAPQCQKLDACVNCHYHKQSFEDRLNQCEDECYGHTKIDVQFTNLLFFGNTSDTSICPDIRIGTGCYIKYTYKYNYKDYNINILIENIENCVESYYYLGALCLGTIIIVGILTVLGWKFFCEYQDRTEYSKFIKSLQSNTREFENPLHVLPVTNYQNPTFNDNK